MAKQLEKGYDPNTVEKNIYAFWLNGGYFHAEVDKTKKPYTIVMPPPNITGQLHMGHAIDNTLQDILIRWRRMQGYSALWLPGTDHASIATEAKIVEAMAAEGITKLDIGRDGFLKRAWDWKKQYSGRIIEQLKKLGSSCDWERERFTLDEGCSKAVKEAFLRLHQKGLIYRGERIVNWCPKCLTSISDAEVEFEEKDGHFWHIRYPLTDGNGFIEVATTRPETMLGDTAVAVNPKDERYQKFVGKTLILPLVGREIPVIADDYVELDFGTGCVKITPAHDPNDFEVGLRHKLAVIDVMDDHAVMNKNAGKYEGLDRYEARKLIVADLEAGGYLVKIEPHSHNVGTCYRCSTVVEPKVSMQWFVSMKQLAEPAIEAVRSGKTEFIPERFDKIYFHWMENIKDWCISRQLWWGHRIPAWYCDSCGEIIVCGEQPNSCTKCGGTKLTLDPDTLDTWFSSGLWPFSTLGWPDKTPELEYFFPTSVLVTGYDIIFFWVARMIFSSVENMGETPFKTVFIHGLVRDEQGRKMSKSLGNGIDPLEVISEYGADALRFTLATGNSPGNDMRFMYDRVKSSRNFANKIWNAARFVLMNIGEKSGEVTLPNGLLVEDKWIISRFNTLTKEVTENLERFETGIAVSKLNDFIWDEFCDWYIEISKPRLQAGDDTVQDVLIYVLSNTLKLLHPFMPFITEEIWQTLPHTGESIMISDWPIYNEALHFASEEEEMFKLMEAIRAIRNRRAEMNVPPSKKAKILIETKYIGIFERGQKFIERLASASEVTVGESFDLLEAVQIITNNAKIYIPLGELVDSEKELERLTKEKKSAEDEIARQEAKLSNKSFVDRAPANVVDIERDKLAKAKEKLVKIEESINPLK